MTNFGLISKRLGEKSGLGTPGICITTDVKLFHVPLLLLEIVDNYLTYQYIYSWAASMFGFFSLEKQGMLWMEPKLQAEIVIKYVWQKRPHTNTKLPKPTWLHGWQKHKPKFTTNTKANLITCLPSLRYHSNSSSFNRH